VHGIRAACKVVKSRYSKPFEAVQIKIPYSTGMDPYSGLVDLFEKKGLITQQGNRLKYIDSFGKEHLAYRKDWNGKMLDLVMSDFEEKTNSKVNIGEESEESEAELIGEDNQAEELELDGREQDY